MIRIIVHVLNEDPVVGELDVMPSVDTLNLIVHNPRLRDGKPVSYLAKNVKSVIWPMYRINFVEIYPEEDEEEIISQVRE